MIPVGNGESRDPYVRFLGRPVFVTDIRGTRWAGTLRELTYNYVTLDEDLILSRARIVAVKLAGAKP